MGARFWNRPSARAMVEPMSKRRPLLSIAVLPQQRIGASDPRDRIPVRPGSQRRLAISIVGPFAGQLEWTAATISSIRVKRPGRLNSSVVTVPGEARVRRDIGSTWLPAPSE
jgi:hypothetical protein